MFKNLIQSRKFIAMVIGLILVVVVAFLPGFPDIQERSTELAMLVVSYIFGTAIDPMVNCDAVLKNILKSQKFWTLFGGLVFMVVIQVVPDLPFTEEQVLAFIGILSSYIVGKGVTDNIRATKFSLK